jgi:dipeptidyl aminopeptidase/acylaminoacyl peptidase
MKNILLLTFLFICFHGTTHAQNGKIVEQKPYTFADSSIALIQRTVPSIKNLISNVDFFKIVYLSDGLKVKGYMAVPKKAGKFPCVIYNRGGNKDLGMINNTSLARFLGEIANWGYVVVASQYRGTDGGEGKDEFGGAEVSDVLNLIPLLSNVEKADTARIGMYGWSRGGMMTYLALTKTDRIKAAIIGSGLSDAFDTAKKRPEIDSVFTELIPGYTSNRDTLLKSRSAIQWADKLNKSTPILILTGSADWRVSPEQQIEMVSKLYELKHPVRFHLFEGGQHSLIEHSREVNQK